MATWDKDVIFIQLVTATTGADDESAHTVQFQPIDQAYPTGVVTGTQCSTELSRYYPASDLDDTNCYDIYVDSVCIGRIFGKATLPSVGG